MTFPHATRTRGWSDEKRQVVRLGFYEDGIDVNPVAQVALSAHDALALRDLLTHILEKSNEAPSLN
jgi:hypothetical protein